MFSWAYWVRDLHLLFQICCLKPVLYQGPAPEKVMILP